MKKITTSLIGLLLLAAVGFGVNALLESRADARRDGDATARASQARPLPVRVGTLELQSSILVERTFTGTVVAARAVDIAFEATGRIAAVHVREGDAVEAGDVLAELDLELLTAERAQVAARRTALEARLSELERGPREETIDAAEAEVNAIEEELALARTRRDRRAELAEKGTISAEQLDVTAAEVKTIAARLAAAKARLTELENGTREETIAAQRGALEELDASLATIDVRIEKTKIVAPFDGEIAARMLDEGGYVSSMMPRAVLRIVETGDLEVRVGLPPAVAGEVRRRGSRFTIGIRGEDVPVALVRSTPTVDATTRAVTVIFEIEEGSGARPGDVATLRMRLARDESGAWVPLAALSESTRGLWSMYRVTDDEVSRMEVEILHVEGDRAFVRGTFEGGERFVISGAHRLVPGQAVEPRP